MQIARSTDVGGHTAARHLAFTALPYIAAFAIPFCVLCVAFALSDMYPFGSTSVMLYDMPLQYVDYFGWFSKVLRGDANLLYSNAAGLGGGMFGLFSYYLASPFNLLAAFWQPEDMPKFFSVLYLLKIPAASVTCLVFLRGRLLAPHAKNFAQACRLCAAAPLSEHIALLVFACAYALSGYVLGYASNIMWLDGVIMLPLAALGTFRLVQRRTHVGLFLACTAAALFNWYTGYMVYLYCVLYFFYELARDAGLRGQRVRLCARFGTTMLLAVGASMVILLPTVLSLLGGKGGDLVGTEAFSQPFNLSHNPLAVPSLFCIGTLPGVNPNYNTPAIVISALVLVALGTFFANSGVSKRAKIAGGVFGLVMALSLVFPVWTTIWAGFVPESSYTNRNGFAILFTFVLLGAESMHAFGKLKPASRSKAVALGGGTVAVIFACSAFATYAAKGVFRPSFELVMLEIVLLVAFTVAGAIAVRNARAFAENDAAADGTSPKNRRVPQRAIHAIACIALAAVFAGEQVYATYLQLSPCCYSVHGYESDLMSTRSFYDQLPETSVDEHPDSAQFTRVANAAPYWGSTKLYGPDNMALVLAYSTFDHYSSTQESRIQELLANLGYSKLSPVGTYYESSNIVGDALLGVTHIIDDTQPAGTSLVSDETLRGTYHLYRNNPALPLGWGTTGTTHVDWENAAPFANQNALLADAANYDEDVLLTADASEDSSDGSCRSFTITPTADGPVMLYTPTLYLLDLFYDSGIMCDVSVNGTFVQTIGGRGSFNAVCLGYGHAGQAMTLTLTPLGDDTSFEVKHKDGTLANTQNDFWDVSADDLLQVVSVDESALHEQLSRIDSAGFALTAYESGHIAATFNATQDETLVISQPYEDGWSATVNGQPAQLKPAYDGLMGVKVSAGENIIELRYLTPGLVPGAVVSIASVTLFAVWRIAARRRSMQKSEKPASA